MNLLGVPPVARIIILRLLVVVRFLYELISRLVVLTCA